MTDSRAYYNEKDPFAAAWLRELIKAGHIAQGDVDERSIEDVFPNDLRGYTQCHFFAGIGVWSYALRKAGWPDDRPVWTGSCPCQPFSAAGKRKGVSDERHLWPGWFELIYQSKPPVVFGEQVASKDGLSWLDTVSSDLEGSGYAVGAIDLCAAGFGAPHIRQRLYFVADRQTDRWREECQDSRGVLAGDSQKGQSAGLESSCSSSKLANTSGKRRDGLEDSAGPGRRGSFEDSGELGYTNGSRSQGRGVSGNGTDKRSIRATGLGGELADTDGGNTGAEGLQRSRQYGQRAENRSVGGFWQDAEWLYCQDGKYRPVEPGTFPLAHGITKRVGKLRGYGNALCAEVAKGVIEAYLELRNE